MSPSPIFANAPFTFEEMSAKRSAEERETFARYQVPGDVEVMQKNVGSVPVRIYRPMRVAGKLPLLIWMHGGAFIGGGLDMPEGQVTSFEIAHRAKALVISIDYRLCTDDISFPAPQQDALAVAEWAFKNIEILGFDESRVTLGGASAGACLAGSLSLLLRDRRLPVAAVLPIYPVGHRAELTPSDELQRHCDEHFGKPQRLLIGHNAWLDPDPNASSSFYPWPAETEKLHGLPPHFFVHADFDILRSSGEPWAAKLREAGTDVHEEIIAGSLHGFLNDLPAENPLQDRVLDLMAEIVGGTK